MTRVLLDPPVVVDHLVGPDATCRPASGRRRGTSRRPGRGPGSARSRSPALAARAARTRRLHGRHGIDSPRVGAERRRQRKAGHSTPCRPAPNVGTDAADGGSGLTAIADVRRGSRQTVTARVVHGYPAGGSGALRWGDACQQLRLRRARRSAPAMPGPRRRWRRRGWAPRRRCSRPTATPSAR